MRDHRTLYWVACQKCDAVLTSVALGEVVRLFAEHIHLQHTGQYPHYPNAGSTPLSTPKDNA